jgi:hypothetical protein
MPAAASRALNSAAASLRIGARIPSARQVGEAVQRTGGELDAAVNSAAFARQ